MEFTILNIAKKIIKLTDSKSKIIYQPLPEDDPKRRQPNIDLAKKELNWEPKILFKEGIKKTVDFFERLLVNER
jgi:UDP-glucuronate decarboxylase